MSSMVGSTLGLSLSGSSLAFLSVLARVHLLLRPWPFFQNGTPASK